MRRRATRKCDACGGKMRYHAETEAGTLCMGCLGEFHAWWSYGDEATVTHDWRALIEAETARKAPAQ